VKAKKIVLSASQTELLLKTLGTALEEATEPVKELIRNTQPVKLEQDKKRTEGDSDSIF